VVAPSSENFDIGPKIEKYFKTVLLFYLITRDINLSYFHERKTSMTGIKNDKAFSLQEN